MEHKRQGGAGFPHRPDHTSYQTEEFSCRVRHKVSLSSRLKLLGKGPEVTPHREPPLFSRWNWAEVPLNMSHLCFQSVQVWPPFKQWHGKWKISYSNLWNKLVLFFLLLIVYPRYFRTLWETTKLSLSLANWESLKTWLLKNFTGFLLRKNMQLKMQLQIHWQRKELVLFQLNMGTKMQGLGRGVGKASRISALPDLLKILQNTSF